MCGDGDGGATRDRMFISWDGLADAVGPDEIMYLADGSVRLRVTAARAGDGEIDTVVEIGGAVASRQGLNIPGEAATLPAVPEEDLEHLRSARRSASTSSRCRSCAAPRTSSSSASHTRLPLIAKIEKPQAVQRAEEIVRAADCVMVARGDLGIEMRIEEVPIVQKQVIALAGALARPVDHRDADARLDGRLARARRAPRSPTSPTRSSTAPTP